ncbi:cation-translocating P-type ATPase [Herbaspirillum sp. RV1423]|uniref:cation-translocating P-type ATPase n=1 Tax=Herbaspirillum sp. RV1423 TaxID=1443993 RepID=UPI0004B68867|nr:cation-translocating P-type ATPase [Herbaspirillum sp. RV1423]
MNIKPEEHSGLSTPEAARLLARDGLNELPDTAKRGLLELLRKMLSEPMFLLLIACGAIYLVLGNRQEAMMLLGFVFVVMGITFVQQRRAENSLSALRELSGPQALVIRDGKTIKISGRELVCGDIVLLSEGDRIPADISLLEASNLTVDESMLTGESVPVLKQAALKENHAAGVKEGDSAGIVFSGTLVTQGTARGYIIATGVHSALGKIGASLDGLGQSSTPIQIETQHVVRYVAIGGVALAGLLACIYWLITNDWLEGILAGLTLAMAVIPEELPVILIIFLSLGAWRLSQKNVLTRHIPAMEQLGATTVLCVDKTGTLTANKMVLQRICSESSEYDVSLPNQSGLPESLHEVMEFAVLASHRRAFDPMETAIADAGKRLLADTEHLHSDWVLVEDYPLSPKMLAMSRVWQSPDQRSLMIAAKGAPEAIVDLCHLDPVRAAAIAKQVSVMAAAGLRLLAVARATFKTEKLPDNQHDFDFEFLGLVALEDPIRADVPKAIAQCREAGIRVMMLTGDHPATAASIGKQVGLGGDGKVMTGSELARLDENQLRQRIADTSIFCRIHPEQKLRLVQALRAQGEVVAMTGDGVNDAPALKAADIGIAMGARGTDVAREAADIVLLNDDFSSIVTAIRHGRRVFANLRKAIVFVVAVHVPIVGLSIVPVVFGWPIVLMPVHILFLQLIIDPACSIVFEAESAEKDLMTSKPRSHDQHLFDVKVLRRGLWQGGGLLLLLLGVYAEMRHIGNPDEMSRALTFFVLVLSNLGLIYVNRSWGATQWRTFNANRYLGWIVLLELILLATVLEVPAISSVFYFAAPTLLMLAVGVLVFLTALFWLEFVKRLDT